MKNNTKLLHTQKTVFTKKDIMNILDFNTMGALDKFLYRAKKEGFLENPYYGIYTLKNYDIFEFACKVKKKCYISLETVLQQNAIIFQHYDNLFLVSDDSLEKQVGHKVFSYKKISDRILLNPLGIIHKKNYSIATSERAICDRVYLSGDYYFDDISGVNIELLEKISKIYNKKTILRIKKLIQDYA